MTDTAEIRRADQRHLWHPYTDIELFESREDYTLIERAEGVTLHTADGRALLDGIASWWCVNLGHSHPRLVEAIQTQAARLQHSILGGVSHPGAVRLAERLAQLTPGDLDHAFFCGDGCSAVEVALKITVQYWWNTGHEERTEFIALAEGYHGDSLGAVGVGFVDSFHQPFKKVVRPAHRALSPHCAQCPVGQRPDACDTECFASMEQLIAEHHKKTAAVILEPLCQGAAGVRIYPEAYLQKLRAACDAHDLLLIADEIAVGFGRTGHMFACERANIVPDLMVVGKGLTGGYLPMSATLTRPYIYDTFRNTPASRRDRNRTLFHGHTYTGNPVAAACALAALDVYEEENIPGRLAPRIEQLRAGMGALNDFLPTSTVHALGLIGVVEIAEKEGGADRAARAAAEANRQGLFIRPLGPALYLWPPLVATETELGKMLSIFQDALRNTA